MRPTSDADAEYRVLTTPTGVSLLEQVRAVVSPRPADLERWRRLAEPELVTAALRLATNRNRGKAKFSRAERMWFEPVGLEQSTAEPVARHKARRFADSKVLDLCCGIGGDTLALGEVARVVAVDADEGMCRRTRWNAEVYEVAEHVEVVQARAERIALPARWQVHIDPDRRQVAPQRSRDLAGYVPGFDYLRALPAQVRGGAIKLGPASDFLEHFGSPDWELEVISLEGECKEVTAWFGDLVLVSGSRRATRLPEGATWTDRDGPQNPYLSVPVSSPDTWVYDPDPALRRAGLLESFATAHGLTRCAPGNDFLTGPDWVDSPFLAGFKTVEILPLDLKTLRKLVTARQLGPLEIKTKGLDLRPEAVRAQLKPRGSHPATLLLMGGPGPAIAVLAQREKDASRSTRP
jgi:hypothetical protein